MNSPDIAFEEGTPVADAIRDRFLEPFIVATCTALGEMASAEVVVRGTYRTRSHASLGDISVVVGLEAIPPGILVLSFPKRTAVGLAKRMLAEATAEVDEALIRDCVGEIGNVVAGQAKALLAETPYRFLFSLPEVLVGLHVLHSQEDLDCLAIDFRSDQGQFVLQLFLKLSNVQVN